MCHNWRWSTKCDPSMCHAWRTWPACLINSRLFYMDFCRHDNVLQPHESNLHGKTVWERTYCHKATVAGVSGFVCGVQGAPAAQFWYVQRVWHLSLVVRKWSALALNWMAKAKYTFLREYLVMFVIGSGMWCRRSNGRQLSGWMVRWLAAVEACSTWNWFYTHFERFADAKRARENIAAANLIELHMIAVWQCQTTINSPNQNISCRFIFFSCQYFRVSMDDEISE